MHDRSARAVVVLEAPSGFGKTALLQQWRNQVLAGGGGILWGLFGPRTARSTRLPGRCLPA